MSGVKHSFRSGVLIVAHQKWVQARQDRLDDVRQQAWLKQGLDKDGNPKTATIQ